MPPLSHLIAFALAAFAIIIIPGPSVLFVIGRSISLGRRGGLLSVLGNELGGIPLVAAVAFGVGTIVSESILVFSIVKIAGALYLAYLGVQTIRHRNDETARTAEAPVTSSRRIVLQGFLVGITNPKTIVFFVAVLPQFVDYGRGMIPAQMLVLGLVFTLVAFLSDGTWALIAGTARQWFATSPKRLARMKGVGGGMMIGLSGVLLLTGNKR
jgi:threonine/homoserine/homoserine lactone efflux protein